MTTHAQTSTAQPVSRARRNPLRWRPDQNWEAYLFLLPSLLGFAVFVAFPVVISLLLSFADWNLLASPEWVGWANYRQLLTRDPVFWRVVRNTVYFMVTIVPLQLLFGLLLAAALNQAIRGVLVYRVIYFMPVVTTIVAGAIVFQFLLNRDFGIISQWIWWLGRATGLPIQPPDFLNSTTWSKPAVVMLTLWKNTGFTMVIYLAALQGVPQELYDAANVDGANVWQRFARVTIPLISPTTFFLFIIQMIGAFQLFTEAYTMTRGGPAQSTLTVVYYIYQNAFEFQRMGKASAIAWFLFIFIFLFTLFQTRMQRRWVYYETES
ncbi:MAG: sugar ABC transporter permease [Caldilineaceae bacterium]|nr:sugar ABC transporter permease [Caldilineaceae bacterium]